MICRWCQHPIVRCTEPHPPWELCRGWRHDERDPALFHAIVCRDEATYDERGWTIAEPGVPASARDDDPIGCAAVAVWVLLGVLAVLVIVAFAVAYAHRMIGR